MSRLHQQRWSRNQCRYQIQREQSALGSQNSGRGGRRVASWHLFLLHWVSQSPINANSIRIVYLVVFHCCSIFHGTCILRFRNGRNADSSTDLLQDDFCAVWACGEPALLPGRQGRPGLNDRYLHVICAWNETYSSWNFYCNFRWGMKIPQKWNI